jgi:hypothetical protein
MSPTFITRAGAAVSAALALAACLDQPAEARACGKQAVKVRVDGKQRCLKTKRLTRTAGNPDTALSRLTSLVGDARFLPRPRSRRTTWGVPASPCRSRVRASRSSAAAATRPAPRATTG